MIACRAFFEDLHNISYHKLFKFPGISERTTIIQQTVKVSYSKLGYVNLLSFWLFRKQIITLNMRSKEGIKPKKLLGITIASEKNVLE